jgi:hypothetical protein
MKSCHKLGQYERKAQRYGEVERKRERANFSNFILLNSMHREFSFCLGYKMQT